MDENLRFETGEEPNIKTIQDFQIVGRFTLPKMQWFWDCRKTTAGERCARYRATRNEKDTTRARAKC
jgi:hypothetical protein